MVKSVLDQIVRFGEVRAAGGARAVKTQRFLETQKMVGREAPSLRENGEKEEGEDHSSDGKASLCYARAKPLASSKSVHAPDVIWQRTNMSACEQAV